MNAAAPIPAAPPRWRGFNLCEMFITRADPRWTDMTISPRGQFDENHFRWIAEWGFNFVRLPLSYRWWSTPVAPNTIDEAAFVAIDQAVAWAQRYGLHLSLNLHHVPGYCINEGSRDTFMPPEPFNLWQDAAARECFIRHWEFIARRYRGISSKSLSFDLVNEPSRCTREAHELVIRSTVEAIRKIEPARLIVIDGLRWGNDPLPELADLGVVQSCRGYMPAELTHYRAWWAGEHSSVPTWPLKRADGTIVDRAALARELAPWFDLKKSGITVHAGELGCYHHTPHAVFLAWLDDLLSVFSEQDIGWGLWNFRGSFGLLDSGRTDVTYEDWHGCKLDRKLLNLLQRF
ncbi:glycoside hydrolase family 5 protein [Oleiharenicola lentus]|uniref:glycoside hydrolase family 5 protein n=1 Tax=Oleiharenicola lentus TaxID=2508720 RepID=UPI003F6802CD